MIFLHPHRADVLSALALLARSREPLGAGLTRLAAGDPLLTRWADRLAPSLNSGVPIARVLRRERLLSRAETRLLSADPDVASALDRVAGAAVSPPRNLWLVRHLPLSFAMATLLPGTALNILLSPWASQWGAWNKELGIEVSSLTQLIYHPWYCLAAVSAVLLAIAVAEVFLRGLRGLRHLAATWCPEVERQNALLNLIRFARLGDNAPVKLGPVRSLLALLRLSAVRRNKPAWDRDWRTWIFLNLFALPRALRREAARTPDLASRLILLGVVTLRDGRPDWDEAEAACRERLDSALSTAMVVIRPLLLLCAWVNGLLSCGASFMFIFAGIRILEFLS